MNQFIQKHPYLILFFLSLFLYTAGNNLLAITDTSESNYALTAKEMVLSGDWISPQIYGQYWYDKPIFYYWELALSFLIFGFNEFAARLPSALLGVANVLFIFWFTEKACNKKTAWITSVILGTSLEFFVLSKAVITDATLFLFMSAAIAFFYFGYTENKRYYYLCYVFAALATLTKGPIGLFLPGLAAVIFLIYKKDIKEFFHVHLPVGLLLFALITGAWYGTMVFLHGSDFLLNFIGVHNVLRATVSEHPAQNRWYFYILIYLAGFFPWSFVLPVLCFRQRKKWSFKKASPLNQLLIIYGLVIFLFFQIVATKYTTYTFPALFSLSILTARLYEEQKFSFKGIGSVAFVIYLAISLFAAPPVMLKQSGKEMGIALRELNTENTVICAKGFYRTSAVFYSGKTIYSAVPGKDIDKLKPGSLSWNAKNVMPFIALEDVEKMPNIVVITRKSDEKRKEDDFQKKLAGRKDISRININDEYTFWVSQ